MDLSYSTNLPQQAYSPQQLRENEAQAAKHCGISMTELMETAGGAVAAWVQAHYANNQRVLVVVGSGNNGGDGFVVAEQLRRAGYSVQVWPLLSLAHLGSDAKEMMQRYQRGGGECVAKPNLHQFELIIDAVFGIGLDRPLSQQLQDTFTHLNELPAVRVAIDVPSGVNAKTGEVYQGAFAAHHTLTFIGLKQGMLTGRAKTQCGLLWFAPLGVDQAFAHICMPKARRLVHDEMMRKRPQRLPCAHKNNAGHVLVIGGGLGMAGAARLASEAALRCGAGLVSVATHPENVMAVLQGRYELMVHGVESREQLTPLIDKASVLVVGPGLGQCQWAQEMLRQVLEQGRDKVKILDADALNLLAKNPQELRAAVLTPHPKEAARLLNISVSEVEANRFAALREVAKRHQASVLLKGPGTLIGCEQRLWINSSGSEVLASAGMGDVLSGIIAALLAQGLSAQDATCLGAYLHGFAAEQAAAQGGKGLLASDLFPVLRALVG
ncbi:NAD(P)H-hydrate dehydratase [Pseudoalteromonas sp. BDTF-M6]|uniref:NAD(P)H-hydrate dehydratase n=1 Tax=Pseudoalteromonas sp. BDTF-M6 TaxID=2796132 RepID=UPI001BB0D792|nr:NAD(P)H-hydrate dehydratase [Pseudoalteromonas sp. BDTF-M6]MBS3797326.1 NAD(P)H-hydrate dehydratase [Pseudoalteromonas sp. BDTF-M6]